MAVDLFHGTEHGADDANRRSHVSRHGRFSKPCELCCIHRNVGRNDGRYDVAGQLSRTVAASNNLSEEESGPFRWDLTVRSGVLLRLDRRRRVLLYGLRSDWWT